MILPTSCSVQESIYYQCSIHCWSNLSKLRWVPLTTRNNVGSHVKGGTKRVNWTWWRKIDVRTKSTYQRSRFFRWCEMKSNLVAANLFMQGDKLPLKVPLGKILLLKCIQNRLCTVCMPKRKKILNCIFKGRTKWRHVSIADVMSA